MNLRFPKPGVTHRAFLFLSSAQSSVAPTPSALSWGSRLLSPTGIGPVSGREKVTAPISVNPAQQTFFQPIPQYFSILPQENAGLAACRSLVGRVKH